MRLTGDVHYYLFDVMLTSPERGDAEDFIFYYSFFIQTSFVQASFIQTFFFFLFSADLPGAHRRGHAEDSGRAVSEHAAEREGGGRAGHAAAAGGVWWFLQYILLFL